jgi:hypothetical protein
MKVKIYYPQDAPRKIKGEYQHREPHKARGQADRLDS